MQSRRKLFRVQSSERKHPDYGKGERNMKTDIEIAQESTPLNIREIAKAAGIDKKYLEAALPVTFQFFRIQRSRIGLQRNLSIL